MLTRLYSPISRQARQASTIPAKVKLNVMMDEETQKMIENEEIKPRRHAGRMNNTPALLPDWLTNALQAALEDSSKSQIMTDSVRLANHLNGRHPPAEAMTVRTKYSEIRSMIASKRNSKKIANKTPEMLDKDEHSQTLQILKRCVHAWGPVEYNQYSSLLYLVSRSAPEYAVLHRIFNEISNRDKEFKPKTMLDFGSGVGTAIWATSQLWPNMIHERMCVDVSTHMHNLSELIVSHAKPKISGVFYRQYMSLSNRSYDIVVSAYSLLELPDMQNRLETIGKLWAKTNKYLVIVEQGTNAGFKMVNEARDFILYLKQRRSELSSQPFHVFSPCPHELPCPRYQTDNTPCNFEITFHQLPLGQNATPGLERFSYVVFKKGEDSDERKNWPRLVRPTLVRSKHTICRMCTAAGKLEEIIFTSSKHGKSMYRCAKSSRWGDRLPLQIVEPPDANEAEKIDDTVD